MTAEFQTSAFMADNSQPTLVLQDYGTASSLASVGMKVPYQLQNIIAAPTSGGVLVIANVQPGAEVLCVFGFSFRM